MKIYLGTVKATSGTYAAGGALYLSKHSWDCDWYWGFGHVGNLNCHFHFESLLENSNLASEIFESTNISDSDWWVIRDLFKQAYSLKDAAATYRHGGHQTSRTGITDILKNPEMEQKLNSDLERILDKLWEFVMEAVTPKS